jgi:tRNA pseudouridine38-40 synthase
MLVLEYEGTELHGFQYQVGLRTVQGDVEDALRRITGECIRIAGAGRTDAGVHATGQVATFTSGSELSLDRLRDALNAVLPRDVVVRSAREVPAGFHARFSALTRTYRYSVWTGEAPSALWRRFSHRWRGPLDRDSLERATEAIIGTHDFASFAGVNSAASEAPKTTIRSISAATWCLRGDMLEFTVSANAFLPHMVRNLVGTLLLVGGGRLDERGFREVLAARDRRVAGPTAPARGLCLAKVEYAPSAFSIQPSAREISAGSRDADASSDESGSAVPASHG